MTDQATHRCHVCKQIKPLTDFVRNKRNPSGRGYCCTPCNRIKIKEWRKANPDKMRAAVLRHHRKYPEQQRARARRYARKHPERVRTYKLRMDYAITDAEYDAMLATQGGKCAICAGPPTGYGKRLHIDHCAQTKVVRGLLCHRCNLGIGSLRHDPAILENAIRYLSRTWK